MAYKEVEPIIKKLDDEMKSESKAWSDYDKSMIDIGLKVAIDIIKEQPTADVVTVKHGEWDVNVGMNFDKERICPICKKRIESNYWEFCSHCGAKMDGGKEDDR